MGKIKLRYSLVQHESLNQYAYEVIINQVSWETQINQTLSRPETFSKYLGVRHLHAKEWSFVLHPNMSCPISESQVAQIGKIFEYY